MDNVVRSPKPLLNTGIVSVGCGVWELHDRGRLEGRTATVEGAKTRGTGKRDFLPGKARGKGEPRGGNLDKVAKQVLSFKENKEICQVPWQWLLLVPVPETTNERDCKKKCPRELYFFPISDT